MRDIKFRAWDGKRMWSVPILGLDDSFAWAHQRSYLHNCMDWDGEEGFVDLHQPETSLMQFTGLKDKCGVEIYEGDIVYRQGDSPYDDIRMPVEWMTAHGGFCRTWTDIDGKRYGIGLGASDVRTLSVIGNIYEHPHLLEPSGNPTTTETKSDDDKSGE